MGCGLHNVSGRPSSVAFSWLMREPVSCSLGTTRAAAGSAAAFEKIDREYVACVSSHVSSDVVEYSLPSADTL